MYTVYNEGNAFYSFTGCMFCWICGACFSSMHGIKETGVYLANNNHPMLFQIIFIEESQLFSL